MIVKCENGRYDPIKYYHHKNSIEIYGSPVKSELNTTANEFENAVCKKVRPFCPGLNLLTVAP